MLWILCILIGLVLGQHIKLTVSPELQGFFRSTWALTQEKAPQIKASTTAAVQSIKSRTAKVPTLKASEV
jgi:hypothetical protein